MCFASRSVGTVSLRSAAAACSDWAMCAVESTTVPSQSNTSNLKRFAMSSVNCERLLGLLVLNQETLQVWSQRRCDDDRFIAHRMGELNALRVKKHPFQA